MEPLRTLGEAALYGIGLVYGLLVIGLLVVIKQALIEPGVEWLLEQYEQRIAAPHSNETRQSSLAGKREIIVVSDLHVDTWERAPEGLAGREASFKAFLAAVEPTTSRLYINGDLLDGPPNPKDTWTGRPGAPERFSLKGSILPKYENTLADIFEFNSRRPVDVLYGNHDMAISGLRYDLVRRPQLLQRLRVPYNKSWYPNLIIGVPPARPDLEGKGQEQYRFYVDHGHFYDPVLLLYLRDFLFAALRSDLREAMTTIVLAGQRRTAEDQVPKQGIAAPKPETRDQRIGHSLVRYRWRWKARRVLTHRNAAEVKQGHRPLTGGLFGHTHLPDSYTYRIWSARGLTYVNTGDWMGETGHGTYAVITQDGVVKRYDWLIAEERAPYHQGEAATA